jgi:SAM-dependent methyltransferase
MTAPTLNASQARPHIIHWCAGVSCCDAQWEQAYLDFETPQQEVGKFLRRYRRLGVDRWPRQWQIVELFCGRGNGLAALARLGFEHLEGVDLSGELLSRYQGDARLYVGDCRDLKFAAESKDAIVIHGGLHHLPHLPDDLEGVLAEAHRVLRHGGRFVAVEPWQTPFLRLAHAACSSRLLRRGWRKLDALARMTEREIVTYEQWLGQPTQILKVFDRWFEPLSRRMAWGKLLYVGKKP